jgi:hypothetical protein
VGDELPFQAAGVVEVELLQRLAGREPGRADAALAAVGLPRGDLPLQARDEELLMRPGLGAGAGRVPAALQHRPGRTAPRPGRTRPGSHAATADQPWPSTGSDENTSSADSRASTRPPPDQPDGATTHAGHCRDPVIEPHGNLAEFLGGGAVLLSALGYAAAALLYRRWLDDVAALGVTAVMAIMSSVVFAAPAAFNLPHHIPAAGSLLALGALGIVNAGIAYWLFYLLMDEAGAAAASVITYVMPVVALALGVGLLGDKLALGAGLGLILIAVGAWFAASCPKKARTTHDCPASVASRRASRVFPALGPSSGSRPTGAYGSEGLLCRAPPHVTAASGQPRTLKDAPLPRITARAC